jgi:hypothetical protein
MGAIMNRIYILLGGSNSGKSSVLRSLKDKITDRNIFIKLSSFQELVEFCDYEEVIRKLKEYINECEEKARNENILNCIMVIAFAFRRNRKREFGVKCITEPLKIIKSLSNYRIHIIHLRRNIQRLRQIDSFIKDNFEIGLTLESEKPARRRQAGNAEKLKDFILSR